MTTTCVHSWQIEPAEGPNSHGACSKCPEKRLFRNSVTDRTRKQGIDARINDDTEAGRNTYNRSRRSL